MANSHEELQRSIFLAKVRRARSLTPEEKIVEATALLDDALALMRDAIATSNPDFGPEQIHAELLRRLRIARRLDDANIFHAAGTIDDQP